MAVLTPTAAAQIAATVYEVETSRQARAEFEREDPFALGDMFEINPRGVTNAKSGPTLMPSIVTESGFGFVAKGKGAFAGDVLVAFRGTNFVKGRDVWTDANFGLQSGPRGYAVHGGFNDTFTSALPKLREQLQGINPTRVHLVGHSLGGAIATLASDWCLQNGAGQPHLYTFGSPRVGLSAFAGAFTDKAAADNIYRVYHTSDVVSMVPLFPFTHVPLPGAACTVAENGLFGSPVSVSRHLMRYYIRSVAGHGWESLREANLAVQKRIEGEAQRGCASFSIGRYSATTLYAISAGLTKLVGESGEAVGCGLVGGMTILDRMAWALDRLARTSAEAMGAVGRVVNMALQFIGLKAIDFSKMTFNFIRSVLFRLFGVVYGMAREAINAAGR